MKTATLGLAVAGSIACAAPALSETKPTLSSQSVFPIVDCCNANIVLRFTADPAPFGVAYAGHHCDPAGCGRAEPADCLDDRLGCALALPLGLLRPVRPGAPA